MASEDDTPMPHNRRTILVRYSCVPTYYLYLLVLSLNHSQIGSLVVLNESQQQLPQQQLQQQHSP